MSKEDDDLDLERDSTPVPDIPEKIESTERDSLSSLRVERRLPVVIIEESSPPQFPNTLLLPCALPVDDVPPDDVLPIELFPLRSNESSEPPFMMESAVGPNVKESNEELLRWSPAADWFAIFTSPSLNKFKNPPKAPTPLEPTKFVL